MDVVVRLALEGEKVGTEIAPVVLTNEPELLESDDDDDDAFAAATLKSSSELLVEEFDSS